MGSGCVARGAVNCPINFILNPFFVTVTPQKLHLTFGILKLPVTVLKRKATAVCFLPGVIMISNYD